MHLKTQISRELDRLELLLDQIKQAETERDALLEAGLPADDRADDARCLSPQRCRPRHDEVGDLSPSWLFAYAGSVRPRYREDAPVGVDKHEVPQSRLWAENWRAASHTSEGAVATARRLPSVLRPGTCLASRAARRLHERRRVSILRTSARSRSSASVTERAARAFWPGVASLRAGRSGQARPRRARRGQRSRPTPPSTKR